MINVGTARFLWTVSKAEFAQWMVAFVVTVAGGVSYGIAGTETLHRL